MRDLKVDASWPPGACCCWGGASKETRLRKRCWARSPGDAKAMSGGRLMVWQQWAAWGADWCPRGSSGRSSDAKRALCAHLSWRDARHGVPWAFGRTWQSTGLSPNVRGCADAEYHGLLEASVNATRRPSRLETTTFGEGGKNVTARATHNLILKQVLHNSPQPRRPPPPRSRGRDEGRQRVI